jgi:hypothetical protein
MRELFFIVRDILLLRRGPQDVPYAPNLTILVVFAGIAVQVAASMIRNEPFARSALVAIAMTGFMLGVLYLLLNARQYTARFTQTVLAQALTSFVLSLLAAPLVFVTLGISPDNPAAMTPGQAIAVLIAFGIIVWDFVVDAHIIRHALDVPFGAGVLITLLTRLAALIVMSALFGKPDGP